MRKRIYMMGTFLICLCLLSFSCAFNLVPETEENSSITLSIPTSREIFQNQQAVRADGNPLEYTVSIKSKDGKYSNEKNCLEGEPITFNNLSRNTYIIKATAEDDKYIYTGTVPEKTLKANEKATIKIDITYQLKGGYIDLSFGNIQFDENATINVIVKDNEDKVCFDKKNISVNEFSDNKYSLPFIFRPGDYKISITGGNTNKEVYVVENGTSIPVIKNVVSLCNVKAVPYHSVYVKAVSNEEEIGTEDKPFKTIEKALDYAKKNNTPTKIVVDGATNVSSPLLITEGVSVQIYGKNNASITSSSSEGFIINGGNIVFYNLDILSTGDKNSVVYESGNFVLENDVYIDKVSLGNDKRIQINKPLKVSKDKMMSIFIPTYNEGTKVIDFNSGVNINADFIKLNDSNFKVNRQGEIVRISKPLTINLINANNYTNISYKVVSTDNQEIIPKTNLSNNVVVLNLKSGLEYVVNLFAESNNQLGESAVYLSSWSKNIVINASLDNKLDFDLSTNGKASSGSLKLTTKNLDIKGYPLLVTLEEDNGHKTTETIYNLPTLINYLPEGNYKVTITGENIKEGYSVASNITIQNGATVESEIVTVPKAIYYVSSMGKDGALGSPEDPFKSLEQAISKLADSTIPITLMIKDNISLVNSINISAPLNLTIIGDSITPAKVEVKVPSNVKVELSNSKCNVTARNIVFNNTDGVFFINDGTLSIEDGFEVTGTGANAISVYSSNSSKGLLNIKGNVNLNNNWITLNNDSKINVLNSLTTTQPIMIEANPSYSGREIFDFANESLKKAVSDNFKYKDNTCTIDFSINKLLEKGVTNFTQTKDILKASPSTPLTIKTYVDNENELKELGTLIRGLPPTHEVTLDLKTNKNINTLDYTVFNPLLNGIETLVSITIPDSIIYIDENTFTYSPNLTTINVTNPSKWCFENKSNPSENDTSELKYNESAFGKVVNLEEIKTILSDPNMTGNKGFVLDKSITNISELCELVKNYKGGNIVLDLHLTSITNIPANAFLDCKNIKKIILPSTLQTIGANAFSGCDNLVSAVFPDLSTWKIGSDEYLSYSEKYLNIENATKLKTSTSSWNKQNLINLYVDGDTGNDDTNNGSQNKRFKTVSKALSLLNGSTSKIINKDINIYVNGTVLEKKVILINKTSNITIQGDNPNATIKAIPLIPSNDNRNCHLVMEIGDMLEQTEPTVTLRNINITGGYDNGSEVGGIILDTGTLILDDGANIFDNGLPGEYSKGVVVGGHAQGLIIKGTASVGRPSDKIKNTICLGRKVEDNSNLLGKLVVDDSFTGHAYVDSQFKKGDTVLQGTYKTDHIQVILPENLFINTSSNKIQLKEYNDNNVASIIAKAPSTSDGDEGSEILVKIENSSNIKTNISDKIFGGHNNKKISLLDLSPSTIIEIPSKSLANTSGTSYGVINNIVLPRGLLSIGSDAFLNSGISSITLPEAVNKLDYNSLKFNENTNNDNKVFFDNLDSSWRNSSGKITVPTNDGIYNYKTFNDGKWNRLENVDVAVEQIKKDTGAYGAPNFVYVYIENDGDYAKLRDAINNLNNGNVVLNIASKDNTIPSNAFDNFSDKLSILTISSNIKIIEADAFSNNSIPKISFDDITSVWTANDNSTFKPDEKDFAKNKTSLAVPKKSYTQVATVTDINNLLTNSSTTGDQQLLVNATDSDIQQLCESIKTYQKGNIILDLSYSHTLTTIPDNAFMGCSKLTEVKFPSSLEKINSGAFGSCSALTRVTFADDAPWLISSDALPKATSSKCTSYIVNMNDAAVNAEKLKATSDKYWLKPLNKNNISDYFANYKSEFAATIYYYAEFGKLSTLTDVLKKVGSVQSSDGSSRQIEVNLYLFMEKDYGLISSEFSGIDLNGKYNEYEGMYTKCLKHFELLPCDERQSPRMIYSGAFTNCDNLITVNYPTNQVQLYSGVFASCDNLSSVNSMPIENGCFIVEQRDEQGNTYKELNSYTNDSRRQHVQLPEGINVIGSYAFKQCTNLNSVIIPSSVNRIGAYAFSMCPNITGISLPQNSSWLIEDYNEVQNSLDSSRAASLLKQIEKHNVSYIGYGTSNWIRR